MSNTPKPHQPFEDLILSMYDSSTPWLPQLWQVIYHEGLRGNHILFDLADLKSWEGRLEPINFAWEKQSDSVEEIIWDLWTAVDFRTMREIIASLSDHDREVIFTIYQYFLMIGQTHQKASLN